jgi:hypothetical protein
MNTEIDIDSILDSTLDDLADLPEFKNFPAGSHSALATMEKKVINDHPCVEITFVLKETLELSDPETSEEDLCKAGDSANVLFMLDNEYGQGNFKKVATVFGTAMGTAKLSEIVEQVKNIDVVVTTSLKADKKDKEKVRMNIVELAVV